MEIKKVKVHTCNSKVEGFIEKCRCRKFVSEEEAAELIDNGAAANIIISFQKIVLQESCPMCAGLENFKKQCQLCKNSGVIAKPFLLYEYGEDIYMRPFLKTPRTATIEAEHIHYAYIKGDRDAVRRIEIYNGLTQSAFAELGAQLSDTRTKKVLLEGTPEPEDDPRKHTGRTYDYGRSI